MSSGHRSATSPGAAGAAGRRLRRAARAAAGAGRDARLEALESRVLLASDPYISEFLASNQTGLVDNYGQRSDWIEIHNPGPSAVDLAGWSLTDNKDAPRKWVFPSTPLGAGQRIVVFASGEDDAVSGQPLHTNFSLSVDGEYLALVKPDGVTKTSEFDPFPKQVADVSYGLAPPTEVDVPLVGSGATARYRVPSDGGLGTTWTQQTFLDGTWATGAMGLGFQGAGQSAPLPAEEEPNATTAQANPAERNFVATSSNLYHQSITGSLDSTADFFRIGAMQAGDVLTITGSAAGAGRGTAANVRVELWRQGSGSALVTDTDDGPGLDALIHRFAVTTADTYYVAIRRQVSTTSGTYSLNVLLENAGTAPTTGGAPVSESESNDNVSSADNASSAWRRVQYRSSTDGAIASASDVDVYRFELTAGDLLSLNVDSLSSLDAQVRLLNASGNPLAIEDGTSAMSAPHDLDAFIHGVRVPSTGTYYVEVRSAGGTSGAYRLEALLSTTTTPPAAVDLRPLVATDVGGVMRGVRSSIYVRVPFTPTDLEAFTSLRLRVRYDDGFVAYLNGTPVAERNAPASPGWTSAATGTRPDSLVAGAFEEIDLSAYLSLLVDGQENILALHGLNASASDSDLLLQAELEATAVPVGSVTYMATPTPGTSNLAGALGRVADTKFSIDRGFYTAPIEVAITTATNGAEIRYTLDGRPPTATSPLYTGPIRLTTTTTLRAAAFKPGYIPSNADTQTYLFLADVIRQPAQPAGFPAKWVDRNNATVPGALGSDYEMDPQVVDDPAYADEIIDGLLSIPTLSIVMDVDDLFGGGSAGTNGIRGIYTNPTAKDVDNAVNPIWERPTSVELIYPDGGKGFQIDAGIQIQGGASRTPANSPKHSLRILFKQRYGAGKLEYDLFGDGGAVEFDALILKAGYNNTWIHHNTASTSVGGQRERALYVHDRFASDVQRAMGAAAGGQEGLSKRGRPVHVYINGLYWGVYDLMERPEGSFAASYLGGEEEDYDAITTADSNDAPTAVDGDLVAWNAMFAVAERPAGHPRHISTAAGWEDIQRYLDVVSFADYMILNYYLGNNDWDSHNWYAVRRSRVNGVPVDIDGFRFLSFDAERVLEGTGDNVTGINNAGKPTGLFKALIQNAEFRQLVADRAKLHLTGDGVLSPGKVRERLTAMLDELEEAIVAESARWGDYRRDNHPSGSPTPIPLYTRDVHWQAERRRLLEQYAPARSARVLEQLRALGIYPRIDAPAFSLAPGDVAAGSTLAIDGPTGGAIYYTLDGSDPRLPGGAINPAATLLTGALQLDANAAIKARAYDPATGAWSALSEGAYYVAAPPALRISEIMYNPAKDGAGGGLRGEDFEFVEVVNVGATPIELEGITLKGVGMFVFPAGMLGPGERAVVVSNAVAFQMRYGTGATVLGEYTGRLSGDGETLTLVAADGKVIQRVRYEADWYALTDGDGFSLVPMDPGASDEALASKQGWRASASKHGSPGYADEGLANNAIVISEVMAHPLVPGTGWIELHNTTGQDIDVSGWFLSDSASQPTKYLIPWTTVIPAGGYVTLREDVDFGWAFALKPGGGTLVLRSADAAGYPGGYREVVDYGASEAGTSFGRHVKSTGGSDFAPLASPTPGASNALPRVGPVVISEIMYAPDNGGDEFIEIVNVSAAAVALHDGTSGWEFTKGITFAFGPGAALAAGERALVVAMDPAAFRAKHGIPAAVKIFGPWAGVLRDDGEDLVLSRPVDGRLVQVDRVNYEDAGGWSSLAKRGGPSLQRVSLTAYGNDAGNWRPSPAGGTPGAANVFTAVPAVDLGADLAIVEGGSIARVGSFVDADAGESWSASVDYGDGAGWQALSLNADKTFALSKAYADDGVYTVRVRVTDSRGLVGEDAVLVTVAGAAPTMTLNPVTVGEGAATAIGPTARADASSIDQAAGFRFSYDWGDDGTFDVIGVNTPSASPPVALIGDQGSFAVRVRMVDKDGKWTERTTTVTVTSVAPTATIFTGGAVSEGSAGLVGFFAQEDPSPADRAAGFTYAFDFDDDGVFEIPATASSQVPVPAEFLAAGPGTRTVRARIIDKDGAFTQYVATIPILNVPPTVAQAEDAVVGMGTPLRLTGTFADPGADAWTGTVDYGDGAGFVPLEVGPGRTFTIDHAWGEPGAYTVTVRISDGDAVGEMAFDVTVRGPTLRATAGAADALAVRRSADGRAVEFFENVPLTGAPTFTIPVELVDDVTVDLPAGSGEVDDEVLVSFEHGDVLGEGGALVLAAGAARVRAVAAGPEDRFDLEALGSAKVTLGAGGAQRLRALRVGDGAKVTLEGPGGVLDVMHLDFAGGGGTLDLGDGAMVVRATPATREATLAAVSAAIASARNGGQWDGPGIASAWAAGDVLRTVGVLLNDRTPGSATPTPVFPATFGGVPVDASSILVRATRAGDADLNGTLDAADYYRIDAGSALGRTAFADGDFDHGGTVGPDDYLLIDAAFMEQVRGSSAASAAAPAELPDASAPASPQLPEATEEDDDDDDRREAAAPAFDFGVAPILPF